MLEKIVATSDASPLLAMLVFRVYAVSSEALIDNK